MAIPGIPGYSTGAMKTFLIAVFCLVVTGFAGAQEFPTKPVRIIVPFTPGGPNDLAVRPVAEKLTELLNPTPGRWASSRLVEMRCHSMGVCGYNR